MDFVRASRVGSPAVLRGLEPGEVDSRAQLAILRLLFRLHINGFHFQLRSSVLVSEHLGRRHATPLITHLGKPAKEVGPYHFQARYRVAANST